VPFLHGIRDTHKGPTVEKRQRKKRTKDYVVQGAPKGRTFEKRTDAAHIQQLYKQSRRKTVATSEEVEGIRHDHQEDHRAGDREANRLVFN
jgi:hypothetical protein